MNSLQKDTSQAGAVGTLKQKHFRVSESISRPWRTTLIFIISIRSKQSKFNPGSKINSASVWPKRSESRFRPIEDKEKAESWLGEVPHDGQRTGKEVSAIEVATIDFETHLALGVRLLSVQNGTWRGLGE
jgi:hypothetical protein